MAQVRGRSGVNPPEERTQVVPPRNHARRKCRRSRNFVWAGIFQAYMLRACPGDFLNACDDRAARIYRVAYACGRRGLWLPDRDDQFRSALVPWLFPDAALRDQSLGTRCVRARSRHPESAVGHWSALCGRCRRPFWHEPGAWCRCHSLYARPRDHGAREHAWGVVPFSRRAHRAWAFRLCIHDRAWCVWKTAAGKMAFDRIRCWHRRRLFWTIPVFADRSRADGQIRLEGNAADFWWGHVVDSPTLPRSRDTSGCCRAISREDADAVGTPGLRGSIRPSQLYLAGARLLHLRLSTRIHHRAPARVPDRPRLVG